MVGIKEIVITIVACLILVGGLAAWYAYEPSTAPELQESDEPITSPETPDTREALEASDIHDMNNQKATLTTNYGTIEIELFTEDMPITTENFISLAQDGYYDGTKFHRVIPGFMIQGGDPNSRGDDTSQYGTGGPGYTIQDEFVEGAHLSNVQGTIAMANTGQPNSGGSQFFINVADNTSLDFDTQPMSSRHPVFGRVIEGMDVVRTIEQVATGARDVPEEPVVVESVTISPLEG